MKVRAIDSSNDWLFGKGLSDYKVDSNAVGQSIKTRLQSFIGDCFFNAGQGIDWFNLLGAKDQLTLRIAITNTILTTDGVLSMASTPIVNLDHTTRNLFIEYSVNTLTGASAEVVAGTATIFLLTEDGDNITTEDGSAIEGG